ncbi:hypothetical protein PIB30_022047 [Stylosanthes scabra]|uniref:Uncharacterized protein n=1 Tax=Stylosanthes scabra TaxID=79078 RepID=A0ABU6Z5M4_9FABA|nr:hypothetical protein [Stylosanthes scabra]
MGSGNQGDGGEIFPTAGIGVGDEFRVWGREREASPAPPRPIDTPKLIAGYNIGKVFRVSQKKTATSYVTRIPLKRIVDTYCSATSRSEHLAGSVKYNGFEVDGNVNELQLLMLKHYETQIADIEIIEKEDLDLEMMLRNQEFVPQKQYQTIQGSYQPSEQSMMMMQGSYVPSND